MEGEKETEAESRRKGFQLPDARDELNLAEFPIALLAARPPRGTKTLEFRDQIFDRGAGKEVARKLTITGSDRFGLPTALDDEVILGLIHLTKLSNNFTERTVRFKRYELVRLLGWPMDGRSYHRVTESLNRWLGVTLLYENAWWDKKLKAWVTRGFHIIEGFEILDGRQSRAGGDEEEDQEPHFSTFSWNDVVFRSFQSDNLKRLDLGRYFQLKGAVAKRMFRFLDKRFYLNAALKFDLNEFSCEHIGLSRNNPPTKLKRHLQPAIEELEGIGFLEPMPAGERYLKVQKGVWTIVLTKPARDEAAPPPPALASPEAPGPEKAGPSPTERELTARGVTPAAAAELAGSFEAAVILAKVEVFDWLAERRDKRTRENPAGYLVKSIRDGYSAPKGFESKADRDRKAAGERDRVRKAEEAKLRGQAEAEAREEADRERVKSYWDALTPAAREKLREEALAAANPFYLAKYRKEQGKQPDGENRYMQLILDIHILDKLSREFLF